MGSNRYSDPTYNPWLDAQLNLEEQKTSVGTWTIAKAGTQLSYEEFCNHYGLKPGNERIIFERINAYVERNMLEKKNWAEMCEPFDRLLVYFNRQGLILKKLLYAICDNLLKEQSYKVKGGARKTLRGTALKKKLIKDENRRRKEYLDSLQTMVDYLGQRAPFLSSYPNDEGNPLSGSRLRRLLFLLNDMQRAEKEIETLKAEDRGRKARYAHDPKTGHYRRVGTAVTDPITVLLIYVWKGKELRTGMFLDNEDFEDIAALMEFWSFFPPEVRNDLTGQITQLKERLNYYRGKDILFCSSGWSQEYIPMVYVD